MKRAIVLAGGGAKGAYQAGVWRALKELNYSYDIVCGTSIGALNGCLMAQNDYDVMQNLWKNVKEKDILKGSINFELSIDSFINQSNLVLPFFKRYINEKGLDISPLISLIDKLADERKLNSSSVDFGLVCVEYPNLKGLELTKKELGEGMLKDYLLASASCFPAFPVHYFNDKGYIDGGYYDNLPIHLALEMGADEVLAVDLNADKPIHYEYLNRPNIKMIIPSQPLDSFLDFSREKLNFRNQLGYLDTLKAFNQYKGFLYTLEKEPIPLSIQRNIYNHILSMEGFLNRGHLKIEMNKGYIPFSELLLAHTHQLELSLEDYTIRSMEICAEMMQVDCNRIYTFQSVNKLILNQFQDIYSFRKEKNINKLRSTI